MAQIFGGGSAWVLVAQTDIMTRSILMGLLCASIVCLSVILLKFFMLWREKSSLHNLDVRLRRVVSFKDVVDMRSSFVTSSSGLILKQGLDELKVMLKSDHKELPITGSITKNEFEMLEDNLNDQLDLAVSNAESFLPFLGICAAVTPLIGLFGTVWGLIHAFMQISSERSVDIAVVAPGIAEALLTTLAGLMVAIPALIFFQYFSNDVRKYDAKLVSTVDRFLRLVRKSFVR